MRAHARGLYLASCSQKILDDAAGSNSNASVLKLAHLFPECMVPSDHYAPLLPATSASSDHADVLALCVRVHAQVIVAMEPDKFPEAVTKPLGLEVQHPDEFLCSLLDLSPSSVLEIVVELAADARRPPRSPFQLLERFGTITPHFAASILYLLPAEMRSPS